jgi:hypothetical protein
MVRVKDKDKDWVKENDYTLPKFAKSDIKLSNSTITIYALGFLPFDKIRHFD